MKLKRNLIRLSFVQIQTTDLNFLVSQNSKIIKVNWYKSIEVYFSNNELIFIQSSIFNSFEIIDYMPIAIVRDTAATKLIYDTKSLFVINKFISIKNRIYIIAYTSGSYKQKLEINFTVKSDEEIIILSQMRDWIEY